jgi:putative transposase
MPMTDSGASALAPLLDGSTAGELIPEIVRHGLQQLIELEVAAVLGAERHERNEDRLGYRNGYRPRLLTTQVGDIDLMIPKLRTGSYQPSILEPRRRVDQALYGVVMEAYVGGISTRKVDALVAALGVQGGISRSQVSRICADIDVQVQAFLGRPLDESGIPTSTSMPPTSTAAWARPCRFAHGLSSSRWASMPMAAVNCSASRSVTARVSPSGASSLDRSRSAASLGSSS